MLDKFSDFAKFMVMVLIYTGYLTWWAAGLSSNVDNNANHIIETKNALARHTISDAEITTQTIKLAEKVAAISIQVIKHESRINELIQHDVECSVLVKEVIKRLKTLEEHDYQGQGQ